VHITNNGTSPEAYFADARLPIQVTDHLAAQTTSTLSLPNLAGVVPTYLVPSHTTAVQAAVTSTAPLFFDLSYPFGDPDLISSNGTTATVSYGASSVADGDWTVTPFLVGPTGKNAAPTVSATVSMSATAPAFDPTITSATGDLWLRSLNASASFTPMVADPGQTITIPVTITPVGSAGSRITGTLYISDYSLVSGAATYNGLPGTYPEGSDVAAFHYRYTIKS
jgi:hypothetical protein